MRKKNLPITQIKIARRLKEEYGITLSEVTLFRNALLLATLLSLCDLVDLYLAVHSIYGGGAAKLSSSILSIISKKIKESRTEDLVKLYAVLVDRHVPRYGESAVKLKKLVLDELRSRRGEVHRILWEELCCM